MIFITFLMLWNMLSLSAEDEKRKTGHFDGDRIIRKAGSKAHFNRSPYSGSCFCSGRISLFGGYLYLYSWLELHSEMILYQETGRTIQEILMTRIRRLSCSREIRFWHLLLIGFLSGGNCACLLQNENDTDEDRV